MQEELREHLRNEVLARSMSRKNRRLSRVVFDEKADPAIARCEPREEPPEDRPGVSYWLMRVIRSTILAGGFISAEVYVPKIVWTQVGAKFHAIGAKVSALEHLMILVTTHIYPLEYPDDVHSSEEVTNAFSVFYRELVSLQNNLSKPFTYIKEIPVPGQAPTPNPTTQVGRLTSIFSAVGKNVIKYAEVGYSRIGSVMKTRVSDQEMAAYVALASELCEKCQVLDGWQMFLEKELKIVAAEAEKPILPKKSTPVAKLDLTSLIAHNVGSPSPRKDYSTPREDSGAPSPQQVVKKATSELVPGISPSTPPPLPVSMSPRLSSPRLPSPYDSPRESPRPPSRRMSKNMYDMEKARVCADHSQEGMHEPQRCDIYRADISVGDSHILAAQHLVRLQVLLGLTFSIFMF